MVQRAALRIRCSGQDEGIDPMMRIVVDAMGSDHNPVPDVEGAVLAAREYGIAIVLVGDQARIDAELAKHDTSGLSLEIVHAPQTITMTDRPGLVGRSKPGSSMHVGRTAKRRHQPSNRTQQEDRTRANAPSRRDHRLVAQ